jgi:hypothetical protein
MAIGQASDIKEDETHAPFRWHVEKKVVFPTLTRRARVIDHDWFPRPAKSSLHERRPRRAATTRST